MRRAIARRHHAGPRPGVRERRLRQRVAATFSVGHASARNGSVVPGTPGSNEAVPLGVEAELDADTGTLTFLESLVT